jgi:hypothetical protein
MRSRQKRGGFRLCLITTIKFLSLWAQSFWASDSVNGRESMHVLRKLLWVSFRLADFMSVLIRTMPNWIISESPFISGQYFESHFQKRFSWEVLSFSSWIFLSGVRISASR